MIGEADNIFREEFNINCLKIDRNLVHVTKMFSNFEQILTKLRGMSSFYDLNGNSLMMNVFDIYGNRVLGYFDGFYGLDYNRGVLFRRYIAEDYLRVTAYKHMVSLIVF